MKKVLKIVGMILGGCSELSFAFAAWWRLPVCRRTNQNRFADSHPIRLPCMSGKVIVEERRAFCQARCRRKAERTSVYVGGRTVWGVLGKNITKDKEHGIGAYSDGQLAYLLRTGISRHGILSGLDVIRYSFRIKTLARWLPTCVRTLRSSHHHRQCMSGMQLNFLLKALLKFGAFCSWRMTVVPYCSPTPSKCIIW